ncbi:hypothetical protein [Nocardia sp. KC 131]|uniref:hypothetical protein n=1 Tax=Nocardia arseniciresistens TaxID=3392119 RepID=UPI00398E7BF2
MRPNPGAGIVATGSRPATMAVTGEAPAGRVRPWLAQMGYDRAGWYSWDRLDNGSRLSAEQVHPEWQEVALGDWLTAARRAAVRVTGVATNVAGQAGSGALDTTVIPVSRPEPGRHGLRSRTKSSSRRRGR